MGDQERMNSLVLSGERERGRGEGEREEQTPVGPKYGGLAGLQG